MPVEMIRVLPSIALVVLAGCFDDTIPSSFTPADAAAEAARADAGPLYDAGSLVGDGGGPTTFPCGPTFCPSSTYCIITVTDSGAETAEDCYPLLQCHAGDCACIAGVVATAYCPGGHVTCSATAGVVTTCAP
jgi:hypothetical protein